MNSEIRHQIQEISEKIDKFEVGNIIKFYGNGGFVLKNGNVLVYFNEKTSEITSLGIEIEHIENRVQLRKKEKSFLTKAFKKKLSIFNIERDEKRTTEEKEYLNQMKFND